MTREELIKQCRYYKGESESPYAKILLKHEVDKSHLPPPECMHTEYIGISSQEADRLHRSDWFWNYESHWVNTQLQGNSLAYLEEDGIRLLAEGILPNDSVPLSLKSMFFNRHMHWGGSVSSFKELYRLY